jgi:small subunit ribosomal protein S20
MCPITKSAKEALRQSEKRRIRNLMYKEKIKKLIKKFKNLVLEKKIEEAEKFLPEIYKVLDKAAKENVIKREKASRIKSRISKLIFKSRKPKDQGQAQG